ncbi:MAG: flavin reductase family protein [Clostridia bacterium]|nr:flavin reductase family protein [Clostridia bacterium]
MPKVTLSPGTLLSPVPAVMVSCGRGDAANIITIAWTGIINSDPPYTYVSVRKSRHSHQLISTEKEFVINLTTRELLFATDFCGVKSGANLDKFKEMKLTREDASIVSCPMIAEAPVSLECKVFDVKEFPSHDMFMAEILAVHVKQELMEKSGRLALEKAGLICFSHGDYMELKTPRVGTFGYSVMKPKTIKRKEKEQKR